ncbi:MAG TPA: hypothetical protein VFI47_15210 [Acidimicrobiales bacterium]|nr:hypothetical protein [Acidimicrobiales bacterium]
MTRALDVLVIESHRGAAAAAVQALEAAGHHTLRCHDADSKGFPCRGVVDTADCPLEATPDVALIVRKRIDPGPTPLEHGASCAIRAGIPLVELGPPQLDPFEPWLDARVDDASDVVATCEAVGGAADRDLRASILRMASPVLSGLGVPEHDIACRVESENTRLRVHFDLPVSVGPGVEQALAVRVLDALRSGGRTYGAVGVLVHGPA